MKQSFEDYILKNELESALLELKGITPLEVQAISLLSRLNRLKTQKINGIVSLENETTEYNDIRLSTILLALAANDASTEDNVMLQEFFETLDIYPDSRPWISTLISANNSFVNHLKINKYHVCASKFISSINDEVLGIIGNYEVSSIGTNAQDTQFKISSSLVPLAWFKAYWYSELGTVYLPDDIENYRSEDDLLPAEVEYREAIKFANWKSRKDDLEEVYVPQFVNIEFRNTPADNKDNWNPKSLLIPDFSKTGYRLPFIAEWEDAAENKNLADFGRKWEWCEDSNPRKPNFKAAKGGLNSKIETTEYDNINEPNLNCFRLVLNTINPDQQPANTEFQIGLADRIKQLTKEGKITAAIELVYLVNQAQADLLTFELNNANKKKRGLFWGQKGAHESSINKISEQLLLIAQEVQNTNHTTP